MRIMWLLAAGLLLTGLVGCETTSVQEGAVVGGALGAGVGAIIGNQTGQEGEGALIGAGAGALAGALIGDQVDRQPRAVYQAPQPTRTVTRVPRGHYEVRVVRGPSGERYEQQVWVPDR